MPTLYYGIPAYRGMVHAGHIRQALGLAELAKRAQGKLITGYAECAQLDWSRNQLLWKALQSEADWFLTCDADTYSADVNGIDRMLAAGESAAVIAAPVLAREGGYNVSVLEGESERNLRREEFAGQVVPVARIGTAFMAIRCGWFREFMPSAPWFQSRQVNVNGRPGWIGEDFDFCDRVRAAGGSVLADGRFEPVHVLS